MSDTLPALDAVERPRGDGWGDDEARGALRLIAEDARTRAGFTVCAVEVLRADDMLEFVAIAGSDGGEAQLMRRASPLAAMKPALSLGAAYGAWTFVAQEWMTPTATQQMIDYGWVPDIPDTEDPLQWRAMDMLVARVVDDRGHLRALMYLDEPLSGRRPTPDQLRALADEMQLVLRAVLTAIEREELLQQVRLAGAAREVVRASSGRLGYRDLLSQTHDHLVAGFRADDLDVHVFADAHPDRISDSPAHLPRRLIASVEAAARRCWEMQSVVIVEPGHVWGDDDLDRLHRHELTKHLTDQDAGEVVVVPVGAGPEPLGMIVIARQLGGARWTESESWAALDIGHDVGRAILNTRAHDREQELIAELRRLDDYRIELISTVSHELKNPLGVIVGHVEMLESVPDLPELAKTSIQAMGRSSARLTAVVDDLLLLSRMGNTDAPLPRLQVDLVTVLAEVIEDEAVRAQQQDVTFRTPTYDGALTVTGDPDLLFRLCSNLVNNAVKYSHPGGVVDLSLDRDGDEVVLTCSDEGLGISEEDQAKLFGEFFRSTNPEALGRPGTGLGLAIVARIVSRHGGRIEVSSVLGSGTTFQVTLPV
ncbi:MAG: HAMP domain-containing sensor histidine kinase [Nocardioides sp.]